MPFPCGGRATGAKRGEAFGVVSSKSCSDLRSFSQTPSSLAAFSMTEILRALEGVQVWGSKFRKVGINPSSNASWEHKSFPRTRSKRFPTNCAFSSVDFIALLTRLWTKRCLCAGGSLMKLSSASFKSRVSKNTSAASLACRLAFVFDMDCLDAVVVALPIEVTLDNGSLRSLNSFASSGEARTQSYQDGMRGSDD